MNIPATIGWLVVFAGAALAAQAAEWKPVTGTYAITEKNLLDPGDGEPRDSHLRLQLTGAAASDLYRAMKSTAVRDECTGASLKQYRQHALSILYQRQALRMRFFHRHCAAENRIRGALLRA